ncbi:MAG: cyclic pyranopterin monophosphate synthase MoaC [Acidimicrobiales bacterium]
MTQHSSHLDSTGKLRMVNVARKRPTHRQALASCVVRTTADLTGLANSEGVEALHSARLAGIHGAKQTSNLIPLCHPISLNQVNVEVNVTAGAIEISAAVDATQRTGVEMEALTACAVAALAILNALSHVDPLAQIDGLGLDLKTGGKSGDWGRLADTTR